MSDHKTKRRFTDRARMNLSQDYEIRGWANRLGVSDQELRDAVRAVGDSVKKVQEYLKNRSQPSRA